MSKFHNWLLNKLLKKDGLVAVPQAWQNEYVKLASEKIKNRAAIAEIVNLYNELLKDYYNQCSAREIMDILKAEKVIYKSNMSKSELAELAYNEFRMTFTKD